MRWCAQAAEVAVLIFTYVHCDVLTHPETFVGATADCTPVWPKPTKR